MSREPEGFGSCDFCDQALAPGAKQVFTLTSPCGTYQSTAGYLYCLPCWRERHGDRRPPRWGK